MKICYDNEHKIKYSKKTGKFYIGQNTYYEHDECLECGCPYLGHEDSKYCDYKCVCISENNRKKIGDAERGVRNHFFGKKRPDHSDLMKKISYFCGKKGEKSSKWKGGYCTNNIPMYDTYTPQLEPMESCRRNTTDPNILEVKCTYCGKWYEPTRPEVRQRIKGINNNNGNRFYCSSKCKQNCTIFNRQEYPKGYKSYPDPRPHQKEMKIRTFEKDESLCQICGIVVTLETSICHHEVPVAINGLISLDDNNCWTLCIDCEKYVHSLPGCSYGEIRKKSQELKMCI